MEQCLDVYGAYLRNLSRRTALDSIIGLPYRPNPTGIPSEISDWVKKLVDCRVLIWLEQAHLEWVESTLTYLLQSLLNHQRKPKWRWAWGLNCFRNLMATYCEHAVDHVTKQTESQNLAVAEYLKHKRTADRTQACTSCSMELCV